MPSATRSRQGPTIGPTPFSITQIPLPAQQFFSSYGDDIMTTLADIQSCREAIRDT